MKSQVFKRVFTDPDKSFGNIEWDNTLCKLDIGILGFLWCSGDNEQKANFFFNLSKVYKRSTFSHMTRFTENTVRTEDSTNKMNHSPSKQPRQTKGEIRTWSNKNLQHMFKMLFSISIDLPFDMGSSGKEFENV